MQPKVEQSLIRAFMQPKVEQSLIRAFMQPKVEQSLIRAFMQPKVELSLTRIVKMNFFKSCKAVTSVIPNHEDLSCQT